MLESQSQALPPANLVEEEDSSEWGEGAESGEKVNLQADDEGDERGNPRTRSVLVGQHMIRGIKSDTCLAAVGVRCVWPERRHNLHKRATGEKPKCVPGVVFDCALLGSVGEDSTIHVLVAGDRRR